MCGSQAVNEIEEYLVDINEDHDAAETEHDFASTKQRQSLAVRQVDYE